MMSSLVVIDIHTHTCFVNKIKVDNNIGKNGKKKKMHMVIKGP